jgi:hypothetical protein
MTAVQAVFIQNIAELGIPIDVVKSAIEKQLRVTEKNRAARRVKLCSNGIVARVSPVPEPRPLPAALDCRARRNVVHHKGQ